MERGGKKEEHRPVFRPRPGAEPSHGDAVDHLARRETLVVTGGERRDGDPARGETNGEPLGLSPGAAVQGRPAKRDHPDAYHNRLAAFSSAAS